MLKNTIYFLKYNKADTYFAVIKKMIWHFHQVLKFSIKFKIAPILTNPEVYMLKF